MLCLLSLTVTATVDLHSNMNPAESQPQKEDLYYKKLYAEIADADSDLAVREEKRQDYWSWERFHMSVAFLSAKRSKDPNTQVCHNIIVLLCMILAGLYHRWRKQGGTRGTCPPPLPEPCQCLW